MANERTRRAVSPQAADDGTPAPWETTADSTPVDDQAAPQLPGDVGPQDGTNLADSGIDTSRPAPSKELSAEGRATLDRLKEQRPSGGIEAAYRQTVGPNTAAMLAQLSSKATERTAAGDGIMDDILGRIAKAETVDDVLSDDETLDVEDILGEQIQVWGFTVNESEFRDGLPFYVAVRGVRWKTQEDVVITCGGQKVCAKLLRLERLGAFPVMVQFTQKATSSGNRVLDMVKA